MTTPFISACKLLNHLAEPCVLAGRAIESIRLEGLQVTYKNDRSPLTRADLAANQIICQFLKRYTIPIVSEEDSPEKLNPAELRTSAYWLVDPLDGTKEFIAGRDEFTVNLALIHRGYPILGVVYAPALSTLYLGLSLASQNDDPLNPTGLCRAWKFVIGNSAFNPPLEMPFVSEAHPGAAEHDFACLSNISLEHQIHTRQGDRQKLHALLSASHLDARTAAWVKEHDVIERSDFGSSLKFCKLAEGVGDVYPRFAPTMAWDTAAGQVILEGAGGVLLDESDQRLRYGESGWGNPAFVAWANPVFAPYRLVEHNAAGDSNIETGDLTAHRQVHQLIASLAYKSP